MKFVKKYLGVLLGVLSLMLFQLFKVLPNFLEVFYTNGIYRFIRFVYSYTLAYVPFPLLYIFILGLILLMVNFFIRKKRKGGFLTAFNFLGWVLFFFYWAWGFNYARTAFAEQIDLQVSKPDFEFLVSELEIVDSILYVIRKDIQVEDTVALTDQSLPVNYQEILRRSQIELLKSWGQPVFRNPKIRELKPNGSLLRLKTAGVYFPFVLEGHIDNGLHPIEKPYVMAHEMAHAYGNTDEGVCNFIGFMTCINSDDAFLEYSGWLEYQGYLYRALKRNYAQRFKSSGYKLPVIVRTDLTAIRERLDKYPSIAPMIRDVFYNNYLKAQGVKAGMESYAQITRLAYSYKKKYGGYLME